MAIGLHNLKPNKGARKKSYAVGRGLSGRGTYSGRGTKGQRARSGGRAGLQLKGLRKIMLSMPKSRGFTGRTVKSAVVNVGTLSSSFQNGATVNPKLLAEKNLIPDADMKVKVLGDGEISVKLTVEGCTVSASAKEKIEKAGGTIKA